MGYEGESLTDLVLPLRRGIERIAHDGTENVGRELRRRVRDHTPVAKETEAVRSSYGNRAQWVRARYGRIPGTLKNSWMIGKVEIKGTDRSVLVYTDDPIAPNVEWPTRPHLIVPRDPNGVLAVPTAGGIRFYKLVHHPGTEGSFMMAKGLAETAASWQSIMAKQIRSETGSNRFWRDA